VNRAATDFQHDPGHRPAYCWDCKAWRFFETLSGFMQVNRDGSRRLFDVNGRLVRIEDRNGKNATVVTWAIQSGQSVLDAVADAAGNVYDLHYQDTPLRLDRIALPGGRVWSLHYDPTGRLDRIFDPEAFATGVGFLQLVYGAVGTKEVNDIRTKILPDGETVTYDYYCDPEDLSCSSCPNCGPLDFSRSTRPGALRRASMGSQIFRYAYGDPTLGHAWMLVEPPNPTPPEAPTSPYRYFEYLPCGKGSREILIPASEISSVMSWAGVDRSLCVKSVISASRSDHLGRMRSQQSGHWDSTTPHDPWTDNENLLGPKVCFDYAGDDGGTATGKLIRRRGPICNGTDPPQTFFECDDFPPNSDTCDPVQQLAWEDVVPASGQPRWERLKAIVPASELAGTSPPRTWGFIYWPDGAVAVGELRAICEPTEWIAVPALTDPFTVENCDGETTHEYETDASGGIVRPKRTIDGEGNATTLTYSSQTNMLLSVSDALGRVTAYDHDPDTRLLSNITLPGGRATSWIRNGRGQPVFTALPLDGPSEFSTQYEYSTGGRLQRVRDLHRGTAWHYGYYSPAEDTPGMPKFLRRETGDPAQPLIELETWTWTPSGQLRATLFDLDVTRILFTSHDEFGFISQRNYTSTPYLDECWRFDVRSGMVTEVAFQTPWNDTSMDCSDAGTATREVLEIFTHDDADRLTREHVEGALSGGEQAIHLQLLRHDVDGHVVSHKAWALWSGYVGETTYSYDAGGRLLDTNFFRIGEGEPTDFGSIETHSFRLTDGSAGYDRDGRPLRLYELKRARETTWAWGHDGTLSQQEVSDFTLADPVVGADKYTYEASSGRIARISHVVPRPDAPALGFAEVLDVAHDLNDQIVYARARTETLTGFPRLKRYEHVYAYDRSWNLTDVHDLLSGATSHFDVDAHDRLQGPKFAYDAGLNLVRKGLTTEVHDEFTFDTLNRLTKHREVDGSGGVIATTSYAYDPFNRLIGLDGSSGRRWRSYTGWELATESKTTNPVIDTRFFQGAAGRTIAELELDAPLEAYDSNLQGSRVLVEQGDYGPIYEPYGKSGTNTFRISFQGHEWRAESDLYYMRNRWYDPSLGRFLSVDPVRTSTVNNYQFAGNSPILKGDPLGLLPTWIEDRLNAPALQDKPRLQLYALRDILSQCATGKNKRYLDLVKAMSRIVLKVGGGSVHVTRSCSWVREPHRRLEVQQRAEACRRGPEDAGSPEQPRRFRQPSSAGSSLHRASA
jgi:RHS repeat-associated protein